VNNDIGNVSSLSILNNDKPDTTSHSLFPTVENICDDIIPEESSSEKIIEVYCSVDLPCLGSETNITEGHNRLNIMNESSIRSS
jgi:hypothetical protein